MANWADLVKIGERASQIWKKIPSLGPFLRRRKRKHLMLHYRHLHKGVVHAMREWACEMKGGSANLDAIGRRTVALCTELRIGMGNLLDLTEHKLHCCLKMYQPSADGSGRELATWAIAHPGDERPARLPDKPSFKECSVHAALNGEYDGFTHWRPVTCFCCNNLPKFATKFRSPRRDWSNYYKSTLVFSIRNVLDSTREKYDDIGFLAFDSPRTNAFADMPEIYHHTEKPEEYKHAMNEAAAFHLGAAYADAFAAAIQAFYPPAPLTGATHATQGNVSAPVTAHPNDAASERPGFLSP